MKPKVGLLAFWREYDRELYLKAAKLADRLGYDSFWLPEAWGYESFSLLAELSLHTKNIKLGTGITNVFSRSPALIALSPIRPKRVSVTTTSAPERSSPSPPFASNEEAVTRPSIQSPSKPSPDTGASPSRRRSSWSLRAR